jgi:hypothetical protein
MCIQPASSASRYTVCKYNLQALELELVLEVVLVVVLEKVVVWRQCSREAWRRLGLG